MKSAISTDHTTDCSPKAPPSSVDSAKGRCIACGQPSLRFLGEKSKSVYCICEACATIQLFPVPTQTEVEQSYLASEYATAAHGQIEPDLIRRSSAPYYYSLLQTLREFAGSGAVIDYGAGWGGLVEILINSGFQCQGLELSSAMVAECQARGLPVEQKSLREIDQRQSVAAIAMCGVFEHLLDPRTFLKDAYAVLTPDGVIVSLQPTSNFALIVANVLRLGRRSSELPSAFWVFDPPWHVALYSVKGMRAIAEEAGFELVSTRFAPQGRMKGLYGIVQVVVGGLNRIGWALLRERWPLMVSHIYVLKKRARS